MAMNKQLGIILTVFIGVIVAVALFQSIAQNVGDATGTVAVANDSLGQVTNNVPVYLDSYKSITSVVIINGTTGVQVSSGNYTVTNNVVNPTTGSLSVRVTPGTVTAGYNATWTISGTAQPVDYVDGASGTLMAVILIILAIGIIVFAIIAFMKSDIYRRLS